MLGISEKFSSNLLYTGDACYWGSTALYKMGVFCSVRADWPRALQKAHGVVHPGLFLHAGNAERQLTREKHLHSHSAFLGTAARSCSSIARERKTKRAQWSRFS